MTASSHKRGKKRRRWQKRGRGELWQDFCFGWRKTFRDAKLLTASTMVGCQPPSWSGFVHVNDGIHRIHVYVILLLRGATLLLNKVRQWGCRNKNKNKPGNNFDLNECTQPLTVTTTRAVREEEGGKDRRRTRSKTKGPGGFLFRTFRALLCFIRRGCEC